MFQTIGHRSGGFVQISYFDGVEMITAQRHYRTIGTYRTVAAAKAALTRYHKEWLRERNAEHYDLLREIWK